MTEGLLLMTNDGELKRQLELPRTGVVRTYRARAFGDISQDQLEALAEGITIEGKNREVRRVLAHLGLQVSRLIRTAYGPFNLAGLAPGQVDEIDKAALAAFR